MIKKIAMESKYSLVTAYSATILSVVGSTMFPTMIGRLIDIRTSSAIIELCAFMLFMTATGALEKILMGSSASKISLFAMRYVYAKGRQGGSTDSELVGLTSQVSNIRVFFSMDLPHIATAIVTLASTLTMIYLLDARIMLVSLTSIAIVLGISWLKQPVVSKLTNRSNGLTIWLSKCVSSEVRFDRYARVHSRNRFAQQKVEAYTWLMQDPFMYLMIGIALYLGLEANFTAGQLSALFGYMTSINRVADKVATLQSSITQVKNTLKRFNDL
jgi:ABC-type bacteriocin/lantibiotic exporter with double-glycine peptidase domain